MAGTRSQRCPPPKGHVLVRYYFSSANRPARALDIARGRPRPLARMGARRPHRLRPRRRPLDHGRRRVKVRRRPSRTRHRHLHRSLRHPDGRLLRPRPRQHQPQQHPPTPSPPGSKEPSNPALSLHNGQEVPYVCVEIRSDSGRNSTQTSGIPADHDRLRRAYPEDRALLHVVCRPAHDSHPRVGGRGHSCR